MSSYRQFTPEEAAVAIAVLDNDRTDGLSDDDIQRLLGKTPVLEAVDWLAEAGFLVPATDERGRPRPRRWRGTPAAKDQLDAQRARVAQDLRARLPGVVIPEEKVRLGDLLGRIDPAPAPVQAKPQKPEPSPSKPAKASPAPRRRG